STTPPPHHSRPPCAMSTWSSTSPVIRPGAATTRSGSAGSSLDDRRVRRVHVHPTSLRADALDDRRVWLIHVHSAGRTGERHGEPGEERDGRRQPYLAANAH